MWVSQQAETDRFIKRACQIRGVPHLFSSNCLGSVTYAKHNLQSVGNLDITHITGLVLIKCKYVGGQMGIML